jgi:ssRNA-specific RNase YbeY (16S rRNA maturation enzyme)
MYENVALAIRINEQGDSLTGSMVDDIFFILQKCARRASETGRSKSREMQLYGYRNTPIILQAPFKQYVLH